MPAPDSIYKLIENFERNLDHHKSARYNETQARVEFINPFFEALGWDIDNKRGLRPREVIHEDAVSVSGKTKAPDYGFRVDGRRVFFVEAKKPSVNIEGHISPAFQLRRYAWSAKLPVSLLTDFEEFAVYDTRSRPAKTDTATTGRIDYLTYDQYADRWDDLYADFSREAVLDGSLEKYAEAGRRRGVAEVDAEFLKEIERWRELLARNLALRNPGLTQRDLNYAVQQTIDRIIFLRIAEARGIEPDERLRQATAVSGIYDQLMVQFRQADQKYNSGLFHFSAERDRADHPDTLTPTLSIDDKVLKDIIGNLYYPDSPYEFSVLPADILGQVYEQFLGKVIRLTDGHRAKVEEKPEVRKAGGVYYTPTYIVDYIVEQTVGKLLEGHKPDPTGPVSRMRVLDPACGSGSFLIGAYQYLLDWHLAGYVDSGLKKWQTGREQTLHQTAAGEWHLTLAERKRILLDNIYGVDIDTQAVEVTKLSLLLKVLEGNPDALRGQMTLFAERVLPDLSDNIKCGNSLIGPEYYEGQQELQFDAEEVLRVNVFDWNAEFVGIMRAGGFDAVIGNPPYIRIQTLKEWAPKEVEFYKQRYRAASKGNYDIYVVFVEKALELLNERGRMGYILPHKFFNAKYGEPLRGLIAEGQHLEQVVHFGAEQVFDGATTYTCVLVLSRERSKDFEFIKAHDLNAWRRGDDLPHGRLDASEALKDEWNFVVGPGATLLERLRTLPNTLGDIATIFVGLQTSADRVFTMLEIGTLEPDLLKPLLKTDSLKPYDSPKVDYRILFPYRVANGTAELIPSAELKRDYPNTWAYLKSHEAALRARDRGAWNHDGWYAYGRSQNLSIMDEDKLIVQVMALRPTFIFDNQSLYMTGGGSGPFYGIRLRSQEHDLRYLLGILNSDLFGLLVESQSTVMRGGYIKYSKQYIEDAPIRTINFTNPTDVGRHDRMVALVEQMLALHKQLAAEQNPQMKTHLQRQIDHTDRQIDRLVYELYELTPEEIAIVEGVG